MKTSKVSLKQKTIELRDVKLLDLKGNPVVVGGCIFWRIVGVKAALLNVESVEQYVSTRSVKSNHMKEQNKFAVFDMQDRLTFFWFRHN